MGRIRKLGVASAVVLATSGCAWVGRVGVSTAGLQPGGGSISGSDLSANGRYIVFTSDAANLVPNDTNGAADVFWRDNQTGVTERVSVRTAGAQSALGGYGGLVSSDGRYVAFNSDSSDLLSGTDTNDSTDVFLRDRVAGTTTRVSVRTGGSQADGGSFLTSMTPNAKVFVFESDATNLIGTLDQNFSNDIYVRDITGTAKTERISVASSGEEGDIDSYGGSISDDGRYVAFLSDASNFDVNDSGIFTDVFLRDRSGPTTTRITGFPDTDEADSDSTNAIISGDGTTIAFETDATNLTPGFTPLTTNVYTALRGTPGYELISGTPAGVPGSDFSFVTGISDNARFVLFQSASDGLVNNVLIAGSDAFVRDRTRATTVLAGLTQSQGEPTNSDPSLAGSMANGISGDGRYIMYTSSATDVVGGVDTNSTVADLFMQSNPVPFFFAASPSSIARGTTVTVTLTGSGLHANSLVLLGDNITINSVTSPNESTLNVNLTVAANAVPGTRTPLVVDQGTGAGGATGGIAFIPDLITIT